MPATSLSNRAGPDCGQGVRRARSTSRRTRIALRVTAVARKRSRRWTCEGSGLAMTATGLFDPGHDNLPAIDRNHDSVCRARQVRGSRRSTAGPAGVRDGRMGRESTHRSVTTPQHGQHCAPLSQSWRSSRTGAMSAWAVPASRTCSRWPVTKPALAVEVFEEAQMWSTGAL